MKRPYLIAMLAVVASTAAARGDMDYLSAEADVSYATGVLVSDSHSGITSAIAAAPGGEIGMANSSGSISGNQLTLRAYAQAMPLGSDQASRSAYARVTWNDYLFLTPRAPAAGDLPDAIRFSLDLGGGLSNASSTGLLVSSASNSYNGSYQAGVGRTGPFQGEFDSQLFLPGQDLQNISYQTGWQTTNAVSATVYGDSVGSMFLIDGQYRYAYSVTVELFASASGSIGAGAEADLSHTARLVGLTVPGRGNVTPESLGFDVSFASGLESPNAAPEPPPPSSDVPAPPAAFLAAFGLIGVCVRRRFQSR